VKISRTPKGNVSIILETDQELYYLYSVSNTSTYDARLNAQQLAVNIDEGAQSVHGVAVDLFYGLRKIVEDSNERI
jgi:hypothetical protein